MPSLTPCYRVRIHYREPTCELYAGAKDQPYHWVYDVDAASPQEAKELALAQFKDMERQSSVGWTRTVILIELDPEA